MTLRARIVCLFITLVGLSACDADPAERIQAGNDLLRRAEYRAAASVYQVAQAVAPNDPDAYFNAGIALALSGQFAQAEDAFRMVLSLNPDHLLAAAHYNLGNVYFDQRRFEQAVRSYQQALLLNPADADARYNLELALRRLASAATPSPNAGQSSAATPTAEFSEQPLTPTPEAEAYASPSPEPGQAAGTMDAETAERMLDALQGRQRSWGEQLQRLATSAPNSDKAW